MDPTYRDSYGLPLLRMTFDRSENEHKMSVWLTNKAAEIAKAIGPSKMNVTPRTEKYTIVPYQSTHNTGAAMGADPATSAVNKYLQSWDVANVFVVGASAFRRMAATTPPAPSVRSRSRRCRRSRRATSSDLGRSPKEKAAANCPRLFVER